MKYISPAIKWLNKKYFDSDETKLTFNLKLTFSEKVNYLVKFPTSDKNCLIKEYVNNEWNQEVKLIDPTNVYIKIFLTTNNQIKNIKLHLEIEQLNEGQVVNTINESFYINETHNFSDWLVLKWVK